MAPGVPSEEIARRIDAFQAGLVADGIDAALIVEASDLYYLTGTVQDAHLVVPAAGEPVYLVRRVLERARAESPLARIEPLASLRDLAPAVRAACGEIDRLGLELDVLPAARYLRYVRTFDGVEFADCMPALWRARSRKSAWEVDRIRGASLQLRAAFAAVPALLASCATDRDLQVELEHVLRSAGHQGACRFRGLNGDVFYGAVLAGPDAAVPASSDTPLGGYGPSPAVGRGPRAGRIEPGGAVTVDLVGALDGYLVDATRTFATAPLIEPLAAALRVCEEILETVEPLLVAGVSWRASYDRGLEVARAAGFGDSFMGSVSFIGHGVGLEMNEPPFLAAGLDRSLEAGNVVAVEPKLVFPGVGAVGVENTYLVRPDGPPENLTA